MEDMKFINAQQAKRIYYLKNLKEKWYKTNASISTILYKILYTVMMGH
jgi:hypothetical protein